MTDLFGTTESTELNNTVVDAPTTVATTQTDAKSIDNQTIGIIVGVVGGVVVIVIIIVAICIIRKKRQQGGKYNPKDCENKAGVMNHQFDIHAIMDPPSPERLI